MGVDKYPVAVVLTPLITNDHDGRSISLANLSLK